MFIKKLGDKMYLCYRNNGKTGKITDIKEIRTEYFVWSHYVSSGGKDGCGMIQRGGNNITAPKDLVGKRVRFIVEIVED